MSDKPLSVIDQLRIFQVRGKAVVLDSDLAAVYGVTIKAFNQAVKRNAARFPPDFLLRLTPEEWAALRPQVMAPEEHNLKSQSVTSSSHGGRRHAPVAFTEHGAIMAVTILNSPRAVALSVVGLLGNLTDHKLSETVNCVVRTGNCLESSR
jgi:hypothetical protein